MSEQCIKKDGFTDDKGLQFITIFLQDNLKLSALYCFGIQHITAMYTSALSDNTHNEQQTHYYLLAFPFDHKSNAIADLSDIIKNKSNGQYTVTLLLHKATTVRQLTPNKSYFFYQVMHKGIKLYEHETVPPTIPFEEIPKRNTDYIKAYWHNRNRVAEVFLLSQDQIDGFDTETIQESMMHMAIENTALALIDTYLGYRPIHFSLGYLLDLCNLFCPLAREIFPRHTEEEVKLFEQLARHISKLRSATLGASNFLHTELLQRRCRLFHEKATVLIDFEIKRIEKLNKK
jgi:hypothetical protein